MSSGEKTRKAARRDLVIDSKAEIDQERFQKERMTSDVAERQLEGWSPHIGEWRSMSEADGAVMPWKTYSAAATMREDVRRLLWFAGLVMVVGSAVIVLLLYLSA
jgi:hypothetical protein